MKCPWQKSNRIFDIDDDFVSYVQKYLGSADRTTVKAWINCSEFDLERFDKCDLLWRRFQEIASLERAYRL